MITNNSELTAAMARIGHFQQQVVKLRETAASEQNYRAAAGGFLAEIDRITLEVREYLWALPERPMDTTAVA